MDRKVEPQRPLIFAHRGASSKYAEHTRAAYLQALFEGVDGVEGDIRLTKDGVLILNHDMSVDRTSDGGGKIKDKNLNELREFDFSSWKNSDLPAAYGTIKNQLLTLEDLIILLLEVQKPVKLAIEVKKISPYGYKIEDTLIETLLRFGWLPQTSKIENIDVSIMSFNPMSIKYLAQTIPDKFLCQLVEDLTRQKVQKDLLGNEKNANMMTTYAAYCLAKVTYGLSKKNINKKIASIVGPNVEYMKEHRGLIQSWRDLGLIFRVWGADDEKDALQMQFDGVQEMTTKYPEVLKELFSGREN